MYAGYAAMVRWTTQLNRVGKDLAALSGVHALTDVTGFGLAGHLLEICRGSRLSATVQFERLPVVAEALQHAQSGIATGASRRNWTSYGEEVAPVNELAPWQQAILTDPQTSGGLLVACAPDQVDSVLALFHAQGCDAAAVVGHMQSPDHAIRLNIEN
jgi:selenide,water dikinase